MPKCGACGSSWCTSGWGVIDCRNSLGPPPEGTGLTTNAVLLFECVTLSPGVGGLKEAQSCLSDQVNSVRGPVHQFFGALQLNASERTQGITVRSWTGGAQTRFPLLPEATLPSRRARRKCDAVCHGFAVQKVLPDPHATQVPGEQITGRNWAVPECLGDRIQCRARCNLGRHRRRRSTTVRGEGLPGICRSVAYI